MKAQAVCRRVREALKRGGEAESGPERLKRLRQRTLRLSYLGARREQRRENESRRRRFTSFAPGYYENRQTRHPTDGRSR